MTAASNNLPAPDLKQEECDCIVDFLNKNFNPVTDVECNKLVDYIAKELKFVTDKDAFKVKWISTHVPFAITEHVKEPITLAYRGTDVNARKKKHRKGQSHLIQPGTPLLDCHNKISAFFDKYPELFYSYNEYYYIKNTTFLQGLRDFVKRWKSGEDASKFTLLTLNESKEDQSIKKTTTPEGSTSNACPTENTDQKTSTITTTRRF